MLVPLQNDTSNFAFKALRDDIIKSQKLPQQRFHIILESNYNKSTN